MTFCLLELYVVIFGDSVYTNKTLQPPETHWLATTNYILYLYYICVFSRPKECFPLAPDFEKYGLNGSF